jgi:hypothetical protein
MRISEMSEYSIKKVLMERDGTSEAEALEMIAEARKEILEGEDPQDVLEDWFGLEPDYIFDPDLDLF